MADGRVDAQTRENRRTHRRIGSVSDRDIAYRPDGRIMETVFRHVRLDPENGGGSASETAKLPDTMLACGTACHPEGDRVAHQADGTGNPNWRGGLSRAVKPQGGVIISGAS